MSHGNENPHSIPSLTDENRSQTTPRRGNRHSGEIDNPGFDRLPPHSFEAEQGVLGCCLSDSVTCLPDCVKHFKAGKAVFYDLRHQVIYEAMLGVAADRKPVDQITVMQHLKDRDMLNAVGGVAYLGELQDKIPSAANLSFYAEIVREKYVARQLVIVGTKMSGIAMSGDLKPEELLAQAQSEIDQVVECHREADNQTLNGQQAVVALVDDLERRHNLKGQLSGIPTGFNRVDYMLDGLQFGETTLIGARPSIGKTAAGLCICRHNAYERREPTLFITLEMSTSSLMRRLCSSHAMIPMGELRRGSYTQETFQKITAFSAFASAAPLFIHDGSRGMNISTLTFVIKSMVRKHGIKLVVIDYLQKVKAMGRYDKRALEVAEISAAIRSSAIENKVATVVLAQLNRESEKEKGRLPRLSDLRESGDIEQDADSVILLHRDRAEAHGDASWVIAKQRDGEVGVVELLFNGTYGRFENKPFESPAQD